MQHATPLPGPGGHNFSPLRGRRALWTQETAALWKWNINVFSRVRRHRKVSRLLLIVGKQPDGGSGGDWKCRDFHPVLTQIKAAKPWLSAVWPRSALLPTGEAEGEEKGEEEWRVDLASETKKSSTFIYFPDASAFLAWHVCVMRRVFVFSVRVTVCLCVFRGVLCESSSRRWRTDTIDRRDQCCMTAGGEDAACVAGGNREFFGHRLYTSTHACIPQLRLNFKGGVKKGKTAAFYRLEATCLPEDSRTTSACLSPAAASVGLQLCGRWKIKDKLAQIAVSHPVCDSKYCLASIVDFCSRRCLTANTILAVAVTHTGLTQLGTK